MASIGEFKESFYDMKPGLVDYDAMRSSAQYQEYCELAGHLQAFDLTRLTSREQKLAFWINLCNTIVVQGVVELGIKASVHEVDNFFTLICYQIGSEFFLQMT